MTETLYAVTDPATGEVVQTYPTATDADIEAALERLISQQRDKVVEVALDILPHLQPEEIQDPQDYPEVAADTMFNHEDGLLAGLMSVRAAARPSPSVEPVMKIRRMSPSFAGTGSA